MASLRSEIGPLSPLFALEAAGRLGSFTRAAQELGVTQAAVSKQIVALEERLGQPLFHRRPRHVELTEAGRELFATTALALGSIARAMREAQHRPFAPITVALSVRLSHLWLMPRLQDFAARHPDIPIRIIAQDSPEGVAGADFTVMFKGPTAELGPDWSPLFAADIRAMATAGFLARHPMQTAADVLRAPLIQYDAPDQSWLTWRDWARAAGLSTGDLRPSLSVNRYEDAVAAALGGQGTLLAWCSGDRPLIAEGTLVPLPGPVLQAPGAFYLRQVGHQPGTAEVRDWITGLAEETGQALG
ncbi:LysR family transcriptional regulator [Pararhodobacter sp. CCB-MM2]|uniref:LysR family transcriptional regulator n=1 Tax=Pararhodobacter sp. CCB-MM2 TaxID=1786003 RepID=UPI0008335A26|nr:LysR family transcriptional regulator [Pararhodobacter sp. CCB-MM2]